MKNLKIKNLVLAVAFILVQVAAFANTGNTGNTENPTEDKSRLFVKTSEASSVKLRLINLANEKTTLRLVNENYDKVYQKEITSPTGFAMTLDLSKLASGDYLLTVTRANKSYSQELVISEFGKVIIGEMEEISKPILTQKEGNFVITSPNTTIKTVSILNKTGNVLYEKQYAEKESKTKRIVYNLKESKVGKYTVKILWRSARKGSTVKEQPFWQSTAIRKGRCQCQSVTVNIGEGIFG